ncbi:hypothetical protein QA649_19490 [Bradyrhizobium sp. CB1717]|uniref:hypothetical protein n=1 Tax=Bradyrhizobium sp. CB1717 TaxID=3039154 RepID=UPI0024B0A9E7|nr:hypothetical protein [Bradyrhizobium sp. CB1717]WFU28316.1 hypothetical protein QA649_19490 [Bradyrhizobium sp. CB1717]
MGNSGVGMFLGDVSATALSLWFIGAFVLGAVIWYASDDRDICAAASGRNWTGTRTRRSAAMIHKSRWQGDGAPKPGAVDA